MVHSSLRVGALVVSALALVACGGGAKIGGGKEGAAAALFAASAPSKASRDHTLRERSGSERDSRLLDPSAVRTNIKVTCEYGGTAELEGFQSVDITLSGGVQQSFNLVLNDCATTTYDDPDTDDIEHDPVPMNGSMAGTQEVSWYVGKRGIGGSVEQALKGRITFGGPFDDFIDADVTQSVEWSILGAHGTGVEVNVEGRIETSLHHHDYTDEHLTFEGGVLVAEQR